MANNLKDYGKTGSGSNGYESTPSKNTLLITPKFNNDYKPLHT